MQLYPYQNTMCRAWWTLCTPGKFCHAKLNITKKLKFFSAITLVWSLIQNSDEHLPCTTKLILHHWSHKNIREIMILPQKKLSCKNQKYRLRTMRLRGDNWMGEMKLRNVTNGNYSNLSNNQATTHCTILSSLYSRIQLLFLNLVILNQFFGSLFFIEPMHIYMKIFSSVFQGCG